MKLIPGHNSAFYVQYICYMWLRVCTRWQLYSLRLNWANVNVKIDDVLGDASYAVWFPMEQADF